MEKRSKYERIARIYDILDLPFEFRRYQPIRREMWTGISGRILDAGVGTGRNMTFYPADAQITGIDLSPAMLARAEMRRKNLNIKAELVEGDITGTNFPDKSFDAIVATFLFCVLDAKHQLPALRELARICHPNGEIHILEYAISADPFRRLMMKLWAPWVRWAYGASFDRNTEQYVEDANLDLIETRFLFSDIVKLLILRPRAAS